MTLCFIIGHSYVKDEEKSKGYTTDVYICTKCGKYKYPYEN